MIAYDPYNPPPYETKERGVKPAASPWRPFSEAPKDGKNILACYYDGEPTIVFFSKRRGHWYNLFLWNELSNGCDWDDDFTHFAEIYPPEEL